MPSIRKRNNSYEITVSCGYDAMGRKRTETATFTPEPGMAPSKEEKAVQAFAYDFESRVKNGLYMEGNKITLQEFSSRWMEEYGVVNLEANTIRKYREELDGKILPALGHMKLAELKPHVINHFLIGLAKDGVRMDGKTGGYSKGTIKKVRNVLSSILRTAVEWEIIDTNPCGKINLKLKGEDEKIKFFTPEEAGQFLRFLDEPYYVTSPAHDRVDDTGLPYHVGEYQTRKEVPEQIRVLMNLGVYSGMRKGEILALTWDDIDYDTNVIHVSKTAVPVKGGMESKKPKTRNSYRDVTIPHFLTERLKNLQVHQTIYADSLGTYWKGKGWCFTQADGKQMSYSTPYHALQDLIERYNREHPEEPLPKIPFHGLRHTTATLLIAGNQNIRNISARLGHAQTSTTMNIYAHALKSADQEAADALECLLKPKGDSDSAT